MLYVKLIVIIFCGSTSRIDGLPYEAHPEIEAWLRLHYVPAAWADARQRCQMEGGKLASPINEKWKEAMLSEMRLRKLTAHGVFTGIHATFSKGDYFSIEGAALDDMSLQWAEGEPDNKQDAEACITMSPQGALADAACAEPRPYLCYIPRTDEEPKWDQCGRSNYGYHYDNETRGCYKLHTTPRPWAQAFKACAAEDAHLVVVNSGAEAAAVQRLLTARAGSAPAAERAVGHAFVGVHDWSVPGDWQTIHGESLQAAGFGALRGGAGGCGALRAGALAAVACEAPSVFVCEKRTIYQPRLPAPLDNN